MATVKDSEYVRDIVYQKSNVLISAKYESTLMENKVFAMALSDQDRMINDKGTLRVQIPASELRRALGGNEGSFYSTLNRVANRMMRRVIGVEHDGKFAYFNVIQTAAYDESNLNITFNTDLSKYLVDLKENFTILSLPVMMSFKNSYAFRLYEILRSRAYNRRGEKRTEWQLEFDLCELYLLIGVVNPEDDKVKDILKSDHPDYELAVKSASDDHKKKSLLQWSIFERDVLKKACAEINEKSDILISYETERRGAGGKVKKIIFTVRYNRASESNTASSACVSDVGTNKDDCMDMAVDLMFGEFKASEVRKICEAADYDYHKIKNAFEAYQATPSVDNKIGFMIAGVKKEFKAPAPDGKRRKKNTFNDFGMKQNYDIEELEEILTKSEE